MSSIPTNPCTLRQWINASQRQFAPEASGDFTILLSAIETCCKSISNACSKVGIYNLFGLSGTENTSADAVKKLDVLSNEMMIHHVRHSNMVAVMASEEEDDIIVVKPVHGNRGRYVIAFDPLDGSSNIDANVSIGTIWGIWHVLDEDKEPTRADVLQPGSKLISAGYCMYGSATVLMTTHGHGVFGFTLDETIGEFVLSHENVQITDDGKIYSVNEGNSLKWDAAVTEFVANCKGMNGGKPKSLRYIGSMVGDVHRTLVYGGIFMYPADAKNATGKLRLIYEAAPMAFLVEQAGGLAMTSTGRILDVQPTEVHQRVPVFLGSRSMVQEVMDLYRKHGAQ